MCSVAHRLPLYTLSTSVACICGDVMSSIYRETRNSQENVFYTYIMYFTAFYVIEAVYKVSAFLEWVHLVWITGA